MALRALLRLQRTALLSSRAVYSARSYSTAVPFELALDEPSAVSSKLDPSDIASTPGHAKPILEEKKTHASDALLPLRLPAPEGKKFSQWFAPEEFHNYIKPLYQRGWQLVFSTTSHNVVTHVLGERKFTFRDWKDGMKFINSLSDIAEQEHHHPYTITTQYKNLIYITLTLRTTHALRCNWVGESIHAPGVTRRDIRFAILLEDLYTTHFGGGTPTVLPALTGQPPINVIHKLLNLPARKLPHYCTACGDRHPPAAACPTRDTDVDADASTGASGVSLRRFLPMCFKCRRRHAPMAVCPKDRDVYVSMPNAPCPNCGGEHWLQDCRKPQIPVEEAKSMMLPVSSDMTLES